LAVKNPYVPDSLIKLASDEKKTSGPKNQSRKTITHWREVVQDQPHGESQEKDNLDAKRSAGAKKLASKPSQGQE